MKRRLLRTFNTVVCVLAFGSVAFLSCSTMDQYEKLRKDRVAEKARAVPSPSPTPARGVSGNGTLFNPIVTKDLTAEEKKLAAESLAKAQEVARATDPTRLTDVATGPILPVLRTGLVDLEDMTTVTQAYTAYADAVVAVSVSLKAYGLVKNLSAIEQVRRVSVWWREYFALMQVQPKGPSPSKADIEKFYNSLGESDLRVQDAIREMNTTVDAQRTRVFVP